MNNLEQAKLILKDIICGLRVDRLEISECETILKAIKSLEQENDFLRQMYRGTDEFKAISNFADMM